MTKICFYFQVHQPFRLKEYSFLEIGAHKLYGNAELNKSIVQRIAKHCYLPTNQLLLNLIELYGNRFKIAFSISGTALEQFEKYCPEVIASFQTLVNTGNVELLNETYYHSLASVHHQEEFVTQVRLHQEKIEEAFGVKPKVFRNTELIYNESLVKMLQPFRFKAILCEGIEEYLDGKSPNFVYQSGGENRIPLLLRNRQLSDDISFRFSDISSKDYPLTAEKYAQKLHQLQGSAEIVNLFMDYETFGEHQWEDTGIFNFLRHLPQELLKHPDNDFKTPSEAIRTYNPVSELDIHSPVSWADIERDTSAWDGNDMQKSAINEIYLMEEAIKKSKDQKLINDWRRLQISDHFYYMCTKWFNDGDVHKYFNPYDNPYDAFITFMNIVNDINFRLKEHSDKNNLKKEVVV